MQMWTIQLRELWWRRLLATAPAVVALLVAGIAESQTSTASRTSETAARVTVQQPGAGAQTAQQKTEDPTRAPAGPSCTDAAPSILPPGNSRVTVAVDLSTVWQPRGGEIRFSIAGTGFALDGAQMIACFQWRNAGDAAKPLQVPAKDLRVIEVASGKITLGAFVPPGLADPPRVWWWQRVGSIGAEAGAYTGLAIVPIADLRFIAMSSAGTSPAWLPLDITMPVGITSLIFSIIVTAASVMTAWTTLWMFGRARGVPGNGPFLKIISTKGGYASLSQLQIMLWSFVVGASAIYVMALSGNLINITQGTLVLLGITGASTVGSKLQSHLETQSAPPKLVSPPGAVTDLAAAAGTDADSEVLLKWQDPVTGGPAETYTVRYRVQGTSPWIVVSRAIARPNFRVVELKAATPYEFEVFGVNSGGAGAPAAVSAQTAAATVVSGPGPVLRFGQTSEVTSSSIGLSWAPLAGASTYAVAYRAHDSEDDWTVATRTLGEAKVVVSGLTPNTLFDFRVQAVDKSGQQGPWSAIVAARTWPRLPKWSDLVVAADGQDEVDVTRVQMLFFTVVSAIFVSLKVLTSNVIPEIPEGFLLLMGISNGVYITAKFVPK